MTWLKKLLPKNRIKRPQELRLKYPQYEIGRGTYGNLKVISWGEGAVLKIGAFCSIATGVKILLGGEHRVDWVTTYPFNTLWEKGRGIRGHPKTRGDVVIGNDVWIGMDALVTSGVSIGDGAVIAARSMVTKDIEPYAIYAGNPARLIRMRFKEEIIHSLLEIKWWNKSDDQIEQLLPMLLNEDIDAFIAEERRQKNKHAK
jgi:chloramphenicol O-acetyltransferase type B